MELRADTKTNENMEQVERARWPWWHIKQTENKSNEAAKEKYKLPNEMTDEVFLADRAIGITT